MLGPQPHAQSTEIYFSIFIGLSFSFYFGQIVKILIKLSELFESSLWIKYY